MSFVVLAPAAKTDGSVATLCAALGVDVFRAGQLLAAEIPRVARTRIANSDASAIVEALAAAGLVARAFDESDVAAAIGAWRRCTHVERIGAALRFLDEGGAAVEVHVGEVERIVDLRTTEVRDDLRGARTSGRTWTMRSALLSQLRVAAPPAPAHRARTLLVVLRSQSPVVVAATATSSLRAIDDGAALLSALQAPTIERATNVEGKDFDATTANAEQLLLFLLAAFADRLPTTEQRVTREGSTPDVDRATLARTRQRDHLERALASAHGHGPAVAGAAAGLARIVIGGGSPVPGALLAIGCAWLAVALARVACGPWRRRASRAAVAFASSSLVTAAFAAAGLPPDSTDPPRAAIVFTMLVLVGAVLAAALGVAAFSFTLRPHGRRRHTVWLGVLPALGAAMMGTIGGALTFMALTAQFLVVRLAILDARPFLDENTR